MVLPHMLLSRCPSAPSSEGPTHITCACSAPPRSGFMISALFKCTLGARPPVSSRIRGLNAYRKSKAVCTVARRTCSA